MNEEEEEEEEEGAAPALHYMVRGLASVSPAPGYLIIGITIICRF